MVSICSVFICPGSLYVRFHVSGPRIFRLCPRSLYVRFYMSGPRICRLCPMSPCVWLTCPAFAHAVLPPPLPSHIVFAWTGVCCYMYCAWARRRWWRRAGSERTGELLPCERTAEVTEASTQALSVPPAPRPLIADHHASRSPAVVRTIDKFIIIKFINCNYIIIVYTV